MTGDMTRAANPPPGPATPDENPGRLLTRPPRHHSQVPVMPPEHEATAGDRGRRASFVLGMRIPASSSRRPVAPRAPRPGHRRRAVFTQLWAAGPAGQRRDQGHLLPVPRRAGTGGPCAAPMSRSPGPRRPSPERPRSSATGSSRDTAIWNSTRLVASLDRLSACTSALHLRRQRQPPSQRQADRQDGHRPPHGPQVTPRQFLTGRVQQRRQHDQAHGVRWYMDRREPGQQADGQPGDHQQGRGRDTKPVGERRDYRAQHDQGTRWRLHRAGRLPRPPVS